MPIPSVPHGNYQEFRDAVIGHGYDIDDQYGFQCWDGVDLLYQQSDVGQILATDRYFDPNARGYAKTCWTDTQARALNGSGHFGIITSVQEIKRGDILVFDTFTGYYGITGHIAFADEDWHGGLTINLLGQNQGIGSNPDTGKPFNIWEGYLGQAFLGGFRYDAWTHTNPEETKKRHFPFPIAWESWGY